MVGTVGDNTTFINKVNYNWASGRNGEIATTNPRDTLPAPNGGFRAGKGGIQAAGFVWIDPDDPSLVIQPKLSGKSPSGGPAGYVGTQDIGTIEDAFTGQSLMLQEGHPVTVFTKADMFVKTSAIVKAGDPVYVDNATGTQISNSGDTQIKGAKFTTGSDIDGGVAVMSGTLAG